MKVDYKFIQKFMFLADRPQEGSFVLYRKMEGGMWKTRVTVDNNNKMPKPFLDIAVESDRKTKLHVLFNFEEDNVEREVRHQVMVPKHVEVPQIHARRGASHT